MKIKSLYADTSEGEREEKRERKRAKAREDERALCTARRRKAYVLRYVRVKKIEETQTTETCQQRFRGETNRQMEICVRA